VPSYKAPKAPGWACVPLVCCACGGNATQRAPEPAPTSTVPSTPDEPQPRGICTEISELPEQDGLDQISGCSEVGSFAILESTDLRSLRGLTRVNGSLRIYAPITSWEGLEELESVETLTLEGVLTATLPPNLKSIGRLELHHNPELTELGVASLAVSGINIVDNPKLTSLSGLMLPSETDRVWLSYNPNLTDLSFLADVVAADNLTFIAMPMRDLDALRSLRRAGSVNVGESPNLRNIDALAALEAINWFKLWENAVLTVAPTFPRITELDDLLVQDHPSLRTGPDFPTLQRGGDLVIVNNPVLERLDFAALTVINELHIVENATLSALGFLTVQKVSYLLRIVDNPRLPQRELASLLAATAAEASSEVRGNLSTP
jgi:hypothetical protein